MAKSVEEMEFVDASRIFNGHRAVGLVSNHVPLVTRYVQRRKESMIMTVIGNSFQTYGSNKLGLLSAGTAHEEDITCLAADTYHVYTASGNVIRAWRRGTELKHEYIGHVKSVHLMLCFGAHLLSVDEANILKLWNIKSEEVILELPFSPNTFRVSAVVHPVTYLNKVLLGSTQGSLQLWNLKSAKQVYAFNGWNSPVTVLEQAPAVDVVAVGLASGDIILHNLKFDETVMKFRQEWGPITALTFRSDGATMMISGSTQGHLAIWDLEQQILVSQQRKAHNGAVTGLKSLPSEPLIVTSSPDNTLKMWIFDQSDGGVRLLHLKDGHKAPPTRLRFHDSLGEWVLSAGLDSSLRGFSTVADLLNRNLGTAHQNQNKARRVGAKNARDKLPPINDFASEPIRDKEWDSIAAVHRGRAAVTTWSFHRSTMGQHKLIHDRFTTNSELRNSSATCVTVSACGNFAIIGYDSGHVDRFNLQSGAHRMAYVVDKEEAIPQAIRSTAIRGVASDALNQLVIAAVSNKKLMFWKFKTGEVVKESDLYASPSFMHIQRQAGLVAVALEDFTIAVVEIESGNVIRRLIGHEGRLTDIAFSPDARWLVSAAQDTSIRTWDLPSGTCVDFFRVPKVCVSLAFSANGAFLASAHVDDLGIYLWNNKSLFTQISLHALEPDYSPLLAPLPGTAFKCSGKEVKEVEQDDEEFMSPEQIADSLVTLSLLPDSRWKNLLNLDVIKRRNKPKDPPKVQLIAPFFLQSGVSSGSSKLVDELARESRILEPSALMPMTPWAERLEKAQQESEYLQIIEELKLLGPSGIDSEIRSLSLHLGGSVELLSQFLSAITVALKKRKDFEVVQAYLGLFLKIHCQSLGEHPELCDQVDSICKIVREGWTALQSSFESTLCLVSFFINAVL